ncbi:MAG: KinB sensor domain-containing domain, partial [Pseudomonas sp.]
MKLRSQLLLGSSALIALALLGLLLGLLGVLQLTHSQSQLMARNLSIIEASLGMHQEMGTQVTLLLADRLDRPALKASARRFRGWLNKAGESAVDAADHQALGEVERVYGRFAELLQNPMTVRRSLLESNDFGRALEALRNRINAVQQRYVTAVEHDEAESRRRARLIGGLLGLVGLAVLLIGFLTASTIAQRFGAPVEALARAADQIGQGDYQVSLPHSPVAELAALSRSFGQMAEALSQLKATNLEALVAGQRRLQAVLDSIDDGLLICDRLG